MKSPRSHSSRAFTLLELILVLALIAIIVGVALPSMSNFARSQGVSDSADRALALARWARSQAITRGVTFRLNFDPPHQVYWVSMQQGASFENVLQDNTGTFNVSPDGGNTTTYGDVGEEPGRKFFVPQTVIIECTKFQQAEGGVFYVEFQPSGRCDPGTVTFREGNDTPIILGSLSPTEPLHVLSDDEKQLMGNSGFVTAPAPSR